MAEKACALELYNLQKDPEEKHNLLAVISTSKMRPIWMFCCTGGARCQAQAGGGTENLPHASLSPNGCSNLPSWDFCHRGCAKWDTVDWVVRSLNSSEWRLNATLFHVNSLQEDTCSNIHDYKWVACNMFSCSFLEFTLWLHKIYMQKESINWRWLKMIKVVWLSDPLL